MGRPAKHGSKKWIELNDINSKESKKTPLKSTRTKKITKKKVQLMIPSQINNFSVSNLEMSNRLLVRKIKKVSEEERALIINESEKIEEFKRRIKVEFNIKSETKMNLYLCGTRLTRKDVLLKCQMKELSAELEINEKNFNLFLNKKSVKEENYLPTESRDVTKNTDTSSSSKKRKFSDVTNLLSTNDEIQIPKRLDSKKKPRNSKKNAVLELNPQSVMLDSEETNSQTNIELYDEPVHQNQSTFFNEPYAKQNKRVYKDEIQTKENKSIDSDKENIQFSAKSNNDKAHETSDFNENEYIPISSIPEYDLLFTDFNKFCQLKDNKFAQLLKGSWDEDEDW